MSEIKILPRDPKRAWNLATGEHHRLVIHRFKVFMAEMEDLHFHLDSAVLLPDRDPADAADDKSGAELTSLSVIRTVYLFAKENPGKKLLCLGHTDRSGTDDYNLKLSRLRAHNTWAVLNGNGDEWTAICQEKHVVRDYQLMLKWIANVRYWADCDPGKVDGDHGAATSAALHAFKKHYNKDFGGSLPDNAAVDKPTWDAFFRMYMVGLAGIMQVDESALGQFRQALDWMSPEWDGCGECHPITSDTAQNYRSRIDRRVELLFFESGEEPKLDACHPSDDTRAPDQCELYRQRFFGKPFYVVTPIVVDASAKVALHLTQVRGLYKPGQSDPADVSAGTEKLSGYLEGYKSEDDLGRIFINQIPRKDASVSWEDIKKKNQQYIELAATIEVAEGTLPPDAQVLWEWSDPDDPSDTDMRDDAAALIDPNDFDNGVRVDNKSDDNRGECDFPKPGAGKTPVFEQLGPYALTPGPPDSKHCFTLISGAKSEVRFHCTDAGGDNFRLQATVKAAPGLMVTSGDKTGIMTMWKRVDVEHRRMQDAESIPAQKIASFFERQFVQMDIGAEQLTASNDPYINKFAGQELSSQFVEKEFKNKGKPGWFFICVAREYAAPVGKPRHSLYEGPAKLIVPPAVSAAPPVGGAMFDDENLPQWEALVITVLKEQPLGVVFYEAGKTVVFFTGKMQPDVPKGKTTIRLFGIDFQSDFEPADGSLNQAYATRALYFPRFRYRWPEKVWEQKGYGFTEDVYVNVASRGASVTDGISPGLADSSGNDYFAGRTIIFCRHPSHTKPSGATITVGGTWSTGDGVTVEIDGIQTSYQVSASDMNVPAEAPNADLFVRGQVARGIEGAINGHAVLSTRVSARAVFGKVVVTSTQPGAAGDGTPIAAAPDAAAGAAGVLTLSSPVLKDGGFSDEAKEEIVQTFTHELGHAFGFPHKCGYNTFENPAGTSCTMNYFLTWLYKLGTHIDPAAREVERFGPGKPGNNFCAHHTRGIRWVQLEKNPVIWKW